MAQVSAAFTSKPGYPAPVLCRSSFCLPFLLFFASCTTSGVEAPTPRVGKQAQALRVGTWNIENFPKHPDTALELKDTIIALELDLLAVQEIADKDAFWATIERLPNFDGYLSPHTYFDGSYQKVGFIYRSDKLRLDDVHILFSNDSYSFPRPALQATVTLIENGADFYAVAVHLKAGRGRANEARRASATELLANYVNYLTGASETERPSEALDDDAIMMGDFNDGADDGELRPIFQPFEEDEFVIVTEELAESGAYSFVPSGKVMLDQIIMTEGLASEVVAGSTYIPSLDKAIDMYDATLSDHLPVVVEIVPVPDR